MRYSILAFALSAGGLQDAAAQRCHPSYEGACLPVGEGDVDCAGGSGNGPNYIRGPVYVVGPDDYELDRDGDGIACEPEKARRR
ncbi:MAG TPA: excalibur calcium-binding domain-containing protein [Bauldia sp.]|nr:excalibur calcium-binding domain-containing protein [Bauldia sp.]